MGLVVPPLIGDIGRKGVAILRICFLDSVTHASGHDFTRCDLSPMLLWQHGGP